jgi:hypothetical protein
MTNFNRATRWTKDTSEHRHAKSGYSGTFSVTNRTVDNRRMHDLAGATAGML